MIFGSRLRRKFNLELSPQMLAKDILFFDVALIVENKIEDGKTRKMMKGLCVRKLMECEKM